MDFSKTNNNLLCGNFNEEKDCVIFGTKNGFYVYTIYPQKKIISQKITGGVSKVFMLHRSNIIFFVGNVDSGDYSKQNLNIWDDSRNKIIGQINFNEDIQSVEVYTSYIFVSTAKHIYIYNLDDLHLLHTLSIKNNKKGLFKVLIETKEIIYPSYNTIEIYNWENKTTRQKNCHLNTIETFSISNDHTLMATCSEKGSIIRIFDIKNLNLIKELRRGTEHVKINNLTFNNDRTLLLCSSDKGTIHIFSLTIDDNLEDAFNNSTNKINNDVKDANINEYNMSGDGNMTGEDNINDNKDNEDNKEDNKDDENNNNGDDGDINNDIKEQLTNKDTNNNANSIKNKKMYGMSYLQSFLPKYFSSEWSFIQIYLSHSLTYNIFSKNTNNILSISSNGCFYIIEYSYDSKYNTSSHKIISTLKFLSDNNDPFDNRNSTIL